MIFHALVRRQRYLLTLLVIALSIFYSLPVFAGSKWSVTLHNFFPVEQTIIADNSLKPTQPEQSASLFQRLDLTREQQRQIKQIHHQYQRQVVKKRQLMTKLQQQLSDMMVGTESAELIRAKNHQLNTLRQEIGSLRFESMLATREILTPQQRQKFRELVKEVSVVE
ncbi:MAG: Spy/CpxP family protein refolding chaperone [Cyanobacteria bacterium P01_C01_bin.72]